MYGSICISMSTFQHMLERNESADSLAKDGTKNNTPIDYSLQLKDAYRILAETQLDDWNNWYVLKVEKRGMAYRRIAPTQAR
jgi:uncharacterized protein YtpQ (UPF0354 family)